MRTYLLLLLLPTLALACDPSDAFACMKASLSFASFSAASLTAFSAAFASFAAFFAFSCARSQIDQPRRCNRSRMDHYLL